MNASSDAASSWIEDYKSSGQLPRASVFANLDHFSRLQIPQAFDIDEQLLEKNYLKVSSIVHPDRHVGKSPREQMKAVALSAALNQSVQLLRNPVERAEALFNLQGGVTADKDKSLPPGFLIEMLERRETLEDAIKAEDKAAVSQIFTATQTEREALIQWLSQALKTAERSAEQNSEIRLKLNTFRYLDNILTQCRDFGID